MQIQKQNVIVIESDPQVLKGLVLLLEDMQFSVISAGHMVDLEIMASTLNECPVLLLLPFETDRQPSGIAQVTRLRALFEHRVPAILLSHENDLGPEKYIDDEILVLSERILPKQLRTTILRILDNELAVWHTASM